MGYIYKITNTKNNKCYIGVTIQPDPYERWRGHRTAIKNGTGCPLLMAAFKKHGEEAFKFEVLIIGFDDDVYKYEQSYIDKYNSMAPNGYNAAEGGKCVKSFLGKKHTEETKKKISLKSKEYNSSPEVRERARQVAIEFNRTHNVGELIKNSEKWKKALAEGRIGGKNLSEEKKEQISNSLKEYFKSDKVRQQISKTMTKINGRKVGQYTLDGTLIGKYDSITQASKSTSIHISSIQSVASGKTKTGGGYIWKYEDVKEREQKRT